MQCHGQGSRLVFPAQSFSPTLLPGQWEKKASFLFSHFLWQQHCCSSLQLCKRKSNMYVKQRAFSDPSAYWTSSLHLPIRRAQSPESQAWTRCRSDTHHHALYVHFLPWSSFSDFKLSRNFKGPGRKKSFWGGRTWRRGKWKYMQQSTFLPSLSLFCWFNTIKCMIYNHVSIYNCTIWHIYDI